MLELSLTELRKEFLNFFKSKDHQIIDSYPLIPKEDKSLLLVNSGMALDGGHKPIKIK